MYNYHFLNGEFVSLENAKTSIADLGIVRGYGIFDYFQIINGVPLFLEDHTKRFLNSASKMRLRIGYSADEIYSLMDQLIKLNNIDNAGIKFVATGGISPNGFDIADPTFAIITQDFARVSAEITQNGARLLSHEYVRSLSEIKTTNYTMAVYLSDALNKINAIEPLYYSKESVSECARSNVFTVVNEEIITPNRNILLGITRAHVIQIAKINGFKVVERDIPLGEMLQADEVFLTGTMKNVLPVIKIDEHTIGTGKPGKITMLLQQKYDDLELSIIQSKGELVY